MCHAVGPLRKHSGGGGWLKSLIKKDDKADKADAVVASKKEIEAWACNSECGIKSGRGDLGAVAFRDRAITSAHAM